MLCSLTICYTVISPHCIIGPEQNLHRKLGRLTPSFGSILAMWLKFFRNKTFLFFKIESWHFHKQFEIEIREILKSFNSFSWFIQLLFSFFFLSIVWLSWNFVVFTKFYFKPFLKVPAFYLEKRKSFIPKKIFFKPLSISKQKIFVKWPKIPGCFWSRVQTSWSLCLHRSILLKNALDCSRQLEQAYCYYPSTKSWHISEFAFLLYLYTFVLYFWKFQSYLRVVKHLRDHPFKTSTNFNRFLTPTPLKVS